MPAHIDSEVHVSRLTDGGDYNLQNGSTAVKIDQMGGGGGGGCFYI